MTEFAVDKRDIEFCLFEYLGLEDFSRYDRYKEFNRELYQMVIDESFKLAKEVMDPLNRILDREGLKYENGKVIMPEAFHDAYRQFCEGGWTAPSGAQEYGGQGLPLMVNTAVTGIQGGACMSMIMAPGLTRAAGHLIDTYCSKEIKDQYLEKLFSGKWTATMCLTEAGAGSAVGDLKTKAIPDGELYRIEGEKIFITFGEHDAADNIVHLVLARIQGAPKGIKGVSLFLVPKYRLDANGNPGEFNNVRCSRIEEKMGIHGSPTCTMVFGDGGPCLGMLIGEENQGIKYMFQMMNEARIGVGLQGLGLGEAAYQHALQYAHERIQGVDMKDMKNVDAPRVPIARHPDVRRMLLEMKALIEGMRALLYSTAKYADLSLVEPDEAKRKEAKLLLDFFTPICKGWCSDKGFDVTVMAVQVFGGYGYTREYPVEQYLRDAKIASIYEGTNGIQALDLLGRKVAGKGAASFMTFMNKLNGWLDESSSHPVFGDLVEKIARSRDDLTQMVMTFQKKGAEGDFYYPLLYATPFLEFCGTLSVAKMLTEMAMISHEKLEKLAGGKLPADKEEIKALCEQNPEAKFYWGKIQSARYFVDRYLPQAHAICESALSGNTSPMDVLF